jgi:hypothetical protein
VACSRENLSPLRCFFFAMILLFLVIAKFN